MTIKELKSIIQDMDDNMSVVVSIEGFSIGPSPHSAVKLAYPGFDWDMGKLMLQTEELLKKVE